MIEAINSAVVNAQSMRASTEQINASRVSQAPDVAPPEAQASAEVPKAPYVSPYIAVDYNYDKAVLQIRDSETGDVVQQFPTESRLAEIRRAQVALESQRLANVAKSKPSAGGAHKSQQIQLSHVNAPQHSAPQHKAAPSPQSSDIITVQDVTSAPPANAVTPQVAAAALSAGAQSSSSNAGAPGSVSVLA